DNMSYGNNPKMLVVHHLEAEGSNWTVQNIHNMHKNENGWAGIGYHYYIRLDGTVYKGRPDNAIGSHCQGCNTNTLGISFEGNYDKRSVMPEIQFNAWCELKNYLINRYGNIGIYGHREKGSSECPGKYFPLSKVKTGQANSTKQGWNKNNKGWWYCTDTSNGYYYKDEWKLIDGYYYRFDENGYCKTGWIKEKGRWYYLCETKINDYPESSMLKGWFKYKDKYCYLIPFEDKENGFYEGQCLVDCKYEIDRTNYFFDKDGYIH
ncbi:TPA: N-acetylmuramoyl-L-alanine amidase, partial [Clostridium botulinum]|nr:N-acetylmuramoyl-L-alanine amidase [Clostridium botulinum]